MNELLESISVLIKESTWLAPVLALVAGIFTSVTPCSLSTIPLVIGVVGGTGQKDTKKGYVGALLAGILGGIFSSPCSTPVLIALLAIVACKGSILWGVLLLLLYSIGHAVLVVIAGTSIGFVKKLTSSEKYGRFSAVLKIAMGCVILVIAFYMFYLGF
ncbi:MAG: cytochrome c biogenesis protein CcdA [Velocimicrobium sp.]